MVINIAGIVCLLHILRTNDRTKTVRIIIAITAAFLHTDIFRTMLNALPDTTIACVFLSATSTNGIINHTIIPAIGSIPVHTFKIMAFLFPKNTESSLAKPFFSVTALCLSLSLSLGNLL